MAGFRIDPFARCTENSLARPFDLGRLFFGIRAEMKRAVVNMKPLIQTEPRVQHIAANESRRAISMCLQQLPNSENPARNRLPVFFNAVNERKCGTQKGC